MEIPELIRELLIKIGEDPNRPELIKTPKRVANFWEFVTQGYRVNPEEVLKGAIIQGDYNQLVVVKDIDFYSICEHHLVPFWGKVQVGYLPNGKIIGLSKIPRIVQIYSQRLQVQERMTEEIANTLQKALSPKGLGVIITARHLCMEMRGVEKRRAEITTSVMLGAMRDDPKIQSQFLELLKLK